MTTQSSRTRWRTILLGLFGTILLIVAIPLLLTPLLQTGGFMPHGHCYLWRPELVWLHAGSDMLIGLSYVAISVALIYLLYNIRDAIPYGWMILAFGIFIIACGGTHFMEVWTLWEPVYWMSGSVKGITALASVYTAIALPPLVPRIINMTRQARLAEERRRELELRNAELQELYEKIRNLDSIKTRFFANVSHDLRTPLTLIISPIERMLNNGITDEKERERLQGVLQNALSLRNQVNDLLDLSKLEADRMELRTEPVDLAGIIRLIGANLETLAQTTGIRLQVEAEDPLIVMIDQEKMQRALMNLLSNGLKFTPAGGNVRISLRSTGPGVLLEVADSGPGVKPEDRERLFERYEQGNISTATNRAGTGLGLAIAREMIELHGGTITVDDAPEGGALFRIFLPEERIDRQPETTAKEIRVIEEVSLPLIPSDKAKTIPTSPLPGGEPSRPSILLVEDNPDMSQYLSEALGEQYHVLHVQNGQEALEVLRKTHPDLVITDVMMPVMNGKELVERIRKEEEWKDIPVLILSARGEEKMRIELLREGAQDYIEKPFVLEELMTRIALLVESSKARSYLKDVLLSQSHDLAEMAQELNRRNQDLQQTIRQLQASRSLFDRLWQSGIIGMGVSTTDGWIVEANDRFLEIIGYAPEDLQGKGIGFWDITPEVDHNATERAVTMLRDKGSVPPFEKRYIRKDGTPVSVMVGAAAIEGDEGKQLFFVLDLTDQKRAEEEIRDLNMGLEERVEQRTQELQAINQELEAFSYAVSHDLRAPLRAINGFAHALGEDCEEDLREEGKAYLQRITRNVAQMEELISALLDLSRLTRTDLHRREIDLSALAQSVVETLRENDPARTVDVTIEQGMTTVGDPHLLRVLLENLLGNAWKFSRHTPNAAISFRREITGDRVEFVVEDNGTGFDQSHAGNLFQPFIRLHSQEEFKGTGIGLATVRRIVNRHGGTIRGESRPGHGARFIFSLPSS